MIDRHPTDVPPPECAATTRHPGVAHVTHSCGHVWYVYYSCGTRDKFVDHAAAHPCWRCMPDVDEGDA